jgi:hypothetical protein
LLLAVYLDTNLGKDHIEKVSGKSKYQDKRSELHYSKDLIN